VQLRQIFIDYNTSISIDPAVLQPLEEVLAVEDGLVIGKPRRIDMTTVRSHSSRTQPPG
jgi:hypothetical protein